MACSCDDWDKEAETPLEYALRMVSAVDDLKYTVVPKEPTSEMLESGASVGGCSQAQARNIYLAMLWASDA